MFFYPPTQYLTNHNDKPRFAALSLRFWRRG